MWAGVREQISPAILAVATFLIVVARAVDGNWCNGCVDGAAVTERCRRSEPTGERWQVEPLQEFREDMA